MKYLYIIFSFLFLLFGCNQSRKTRLTEKDSKTSELSNEQLLDTVQYRTFQYFWDGAEPNSGLARERYHVDGVYPQNDKHIVTTGGGGFGLMAILVGIERGFITREQGLKRFQKIVNFLETADRFHGVWPHWLNGVTGKVRPFSKYDDGADIVETAFLIQGLITVKQYFIDGNEEEQQLAKKIDRLWREVEWDWHQKGENTLFWHWSPNYGWKKNHKIRGYNECMIAYILGASSPTHAIRPETYHEGWALKGDINVNNTTFGHTLTLKHHTDPVNGGPLFWAHYSFLGLNPNNLSDRYGNYWENNVAHTMINRGHCIKNPHGYKGYGENCWGLTSSYTVRGASQYFRGITDVKPVPDSLSIENGYAGHRPSFDLGIIAPTAAISSLPYAPEEIIPVIRHFYEDLGDKLWGPYGFYDAFSEDYNWWPKKYLAIDQGPIVVMIENYRSGLLWNLFMKDEDVQTGLNKLGFEY